MLKGQALVTVAAARRGLSWRSVGLSLPPAAEFFMLYFGTGMAVLA